MHVILSSSSELDNDNLALHQGLRNQTISALRVLLRVERRLWRGNFYHLVDFELSSVLTHNGRKRFSRSKGLPYARVS